MPKAYWKNVEKQEKILLKDFVRSFVQEVNLHITMTEKIIVMDSMTTFITTLTMKG